MTGKILLAGLLMTMTAVMANSTAEAQEGFGRGCVVREWATDSTPSYPVKGSEECIGLDRQLDGNDGPNRGRVRNGFRNGNHRKKIPSHQN